MAPGRHEIGYHSRLFHDMDVEQRAARTERFVGSLGSLLALAAGDSHGIATKTYGAGFHSSHQECDPMHILVRDAVSRLERATSLAA